jgi:hypothetical protein
MKKLIFLSILLILILISGCTNPVFGTGPVKPFSEPGHTALFEKDTMAFTVSVDSCNVEQRSQSHDVTASITVKNTGKKSISLVAYSRLTDSSGNEYPGNSVYMSLAPGGFKNWQSRITIASDESFNELQKSAVISVRFQAGQPVPYEAGWKVDLKSTKP